MISAKQAASYRESVQKAKVGCDKLLDSVNELVRQVEEEHNLVLGPMACETSRAYTLAQVVRALAATQRNQCVMLDLILAGYVEHADPLVAYPEPVDSTEFGGEA